MAVFIGEDEVVHRFRVPYRDINKWSVELTQRIEDLALSDMRYTIQVKNGMIVDFERSKDPLVDRVSRDNREKYLRYKIKHGSVNDKELQESVMKGLVESREDATRPLILAAAVMIFSVTVDVKVTLISLIGLIAFRHLWGDR